MKNQIGEQAYDALWNKAQASGMPRRKFLILLGTSGAAAVLAACSPTASTIVTPPPSPTRSPSPSPSPSPNPTASASPAPVRLINQPTPGQFFNPMGATNAEMRFEVMANRTYTMPNSIFFVRSHTGSQVMDSSTWKLNISGNGVSQPIDISYDDLLKMPATNVTRYIECAGNGRGFYASLMNKPAEGGQWHLGAYGIAEWTGVKLKDLLTRAGIKSTAVDVMPAGLDSTQVKRPMPVAKAMQDDTLVAYLMNGDILPIDHGFPARILAPGWIGVASIKWLGQITVSEQALYSDKNTTTYVLIGPDYSPQTPALGPAVTNQVMKSACCLPWPATLSAGSQKIVGYAWSPFGKISKVDVSLDGGQTFQSATLTGPNIERAGTRWEFSFTAKPGSLTITPRAADDQGNTQYPVSQQKWNQLGYLFGAMVPHPVGVTG